MRSSLKDSYTCSHCNWNTSNHSAIGGHMAGHVKRGEVSSKTGKKPATKIQPQNWVSIHCDICGKPCKSSHGILVHKASQHNYISKRRSRAEEKYNYLGKRISSIVIEKPIESRLTELPKGLTTPEAIAAELLKQVVDRINQDANLNNQIFSLRKQLADTEDKLRQKQSDYETVIKAHNVAVQSSGGIMPSLDMIVATLRRSELNKYPR